MPPVGLLSLVLLGLSVDAGLLSVVNDSVLSNCTGHAFPALWGNGQLFGFSAFDVDVVAVDVASQTIFQFSQQFWCDIFKNNTPGNGCIFDRPSLFKTSISYQRQDSVVERRHSTRYLAHF